MRNARLNVKSKIDQLLKRIWVPEFWLCGDHDDEYDTGYSVFIDGDEASGTTYDVKLHVIDATYVEKLEAIVRLVPE